MMKKKAFTLIELMIVVAIIAIIAAIAIPNLLAAKMSANETSAIGSLSAIKNAETLYAERDIDGDGASNYWNANVFGLYAIGNANSKAIKLIQDPATANSDNTAGAVSPVGVAAGASAFAGAPAYAIAGPAAATPKQGYFLGAMPNYLADPTDLTTTTPYDATTWLAGTEYAFTAYPQKYGSSGQMTFILNDQGVVYQGELGSSATSGTAGYIITNWPGENPNTALLSAALPASTSANLGTKTWQVAK